MQTIPQFPFHNSMMQMAFASYNSPLGIHPAMINTPYAQSQLNYKPLTASYSDREKGKSFTIEALLRPDSPREEHITSRFPHPYYSQLRQFGKTGKLKKCVIDEEQWKGGKCKRVRTIFTPDQLERLEAEFERQQYMVGTERFYLASSLNLSEAQVKVWFQNRRIKWRKQNLEMQQARMREVDLYSQGESESGSESDDSER